MRLRFFFDYVDPASWLMERRLTGLEEAGEVEIDRCPWEIRPPPGPLVDVDDPAWRQRWTAAAAEAAAEGLELARPRLVPWSRKAHELALHARARDRFRTVHRTLFQAFWEEGLDLGRVDVLVALAQRVGLDPTEAKAVLDVDRHAEAVATLRDEAERLGIRGVPTLLAPGGAVEGLRDRHALVELLRRPGT